MQPKFLVRARVNTGRGSRNARVTRRAAIHPDQLEPGFRTLFMTAVTERRVPPPQATQHAARVPGGWVYEIVGSYGPGDSIPPERIGARGVCYPTAGSRGNSHRTRDTDLARVPRRRPATTIIGRGACTDLATAAIDLGLTDEPRPTRPTPTRARRKPHRPSGPPAHSAPADTSETYFLT